MVTSVRKNILYRSRGTFSGKQNEARSTSQPQFRSEHNPATIEAHQVLLVPQQLASKINSGSSNNNINQGFRLPKPLTKTMPTFNGKSEKFELF